MAGQSTSGHQTYYVPDQSKLAICASIGLFLTVFGAAKLINQLNPKFAATAGDNGGFFLGLGLAFFIATLFVWFRTAIRENLAGLNSAQLKKSYVIGMQWFIFSEVMFFFAFFDPHELMLMEIARAFDLLPFPKNAGSVLVYYRPRIRWTSLLFCPSLLGVHDTFGFPTHSSAKCYRYWQLRHFSLFCPVLNRYARLSIDVPPGIVPPDPFPAGFLPMDKNKSVRLPIQRLLACRELGSSSPRESKRH